MGQNIKQGGIAIHLKATNEAYLLKFPQTAMDDPMPLHDKIILQLYSEIEERDNQIGLTEIELANKKILLEACESALAQRDARLSQTEELLRLADEIAVAAKTAMDELTYKDNGGGPILIGFREDYEVPESVYKFYDLLKNKP